MRLAGGLVVTEKDFEDILGDSAGTGKSILARARLFVEEKVRSGSLTGAAKVADAVAAQVGPPWGRARGADAG